MHLYKTNGRKYILSSSKIRQADCLAIIDHATDLQAKAMAASDIMLDALKAICDTSPENREENWVRLYTQARNAINKAEGK
jgi:hypothetical protein